MLKGILAIFFVLLTCAALLGAPLASACAGDCGQAALAEDCCTSDSPSSEIPADSSPCTDCRTCGLCQIPAAPVVAQLASSHVEDLLPVMHQATASLHAISPVFQHPPTPPPRV